MLRTFGNEPQPFNDFDVDSTLNTYAFPDIPCIDVSSVLFFSSRVSVRNMILLDSIILDTLVLRSMIPTSTNCLVQRDRILTMHDVESRGGAIREVRSPVCNYMDENDDVKVQGIVRRV